MLTRLQANKELHILRAYSNVAIKNSLVMLLIITVIVKLINVVDINGKFIDVRSLGLEEGELQHPLLAQATTYSFKMSNFERLIL